MIFSDLFLISALIQYFPLQLGLSMKAAKLSQAGIQSDGDILVSKGVMAIQVETASFSHHCQVLLHTPAPGDLSEAVLVLNAPGGAGSAVGGYGSQASGN